MKIRFWGGAQTVTGSKYLVSEKDQNVLVDCGLFQGLKDLRRKNWDRLPLDPSSIQSVILTHAHLDHSGYLPLLVKGGFKGKIFATSTTRELCRILLLDSAYLQEEEAKFANRRGYSKHSPALPLYTREDAERTLNYFVDVPVLTPIRIADSISFEFYPSGHLLGAASVRLSVANRSIIFSGDLGRSVDPIMAPPQVPPGADVVIVESTYGNRSHETIDPAAQLRDIIVRVSGRGGTVLIPSFAVGRAQLLLYHIKELKRKNEIPDLPVFLNSPMANSVNGIFRKYPESHRLSREEAIEVCQTAQVVTTPEESKALNSDKTSKIILAASGMATGGRVLHHLKSLGPDSKNAIVFAGFQAAGTRGEALIRGKKEIKIHGEMWPIRAEVINLDSLSAHADADEILKWLKRISPRPGKIFVTHGEPTAAGALAERIKKELGSEAHLPSLMSEFVL